MGTRRKARELAMQALFYMDMRKDFSMEAWDRFCNSFAPKPDVRPFFQRLVYGVLRSQSHLDPLIERFSENWSLGRMSGVDRNIMRIAVYEMMCCRDIPAKVSINEAVDIGKKFGTEESGAFINGIVDSIRIAVEKGELSLPCGDAETEPAAAEDPEEEPVSAPDESQNDPEEAVPLPLKPAGSNRKKKTPATSRQFIRRKKSERLLPEE
jgi:transcription antitermination protein NusB